ncbi:uncharacterized protein LOC107155560 isoform X2 [Marmota marmota marmota]|uniref:uncharacterized protein LOC107155560 isoform X2 n=1 Tax=Marmota marmota marmota TaxID=9994 RepID=UPI0020922C4C|nr:uncharacterized protein LOC107155560 isoform X2 [Marmota marmota marmota]
MEPAFHGLRPPSPWSPVCFARPTGGVLNQPCPVDAGGETEDKRGRRSQGNSKAQAQATPFPLRPETEGPCAVGSAAPGPWESKARIRICVTNDPGSLETLGWGDWAETLKHSSAVSWGKRPGRSRGLPTERTERRKGGCSEGHRSPAVWLLASALLARCTGPWGEAEPRAARGLGRRRALLVTRSRRPDSALCCIQLSPPHYSS